MRKPWHDGIYENVFELETAADMEDLDGLDHDIGRVICPTCYGRGGDIEIKCRNCFGSGYDPQEDKPFAQCHTCFGDKVEDVDICPTCYGEGKVEVELEEEFA